MNDEALVVGRVVKPHGVHGELVVDVRTDSPDERFAPGTVLGVRRGAKPPVSSLTVTSARAHGARLLLRAEGVGGRDAAEELRGALLTIDAADLEPLDDPDEFHDRDLEGLRVVRTDGVEVGVVREVVHTAAGELLAVAQPNGTEALVPFVTAIVPEVDVPGGRVVVDPPEGLLDTSPEEPR